MSCVFALRLSSPCLGGRAHGGEVIVASCVNVPQVEYSAGAGFAFIQPPIANSWKSSQGLEAVSRLPREKPQGEAVAFLAFKSPEKIESLSRCSPTTGILMNKWTRETLGHSWHPLSKQMRGGDLYSSVR